MPFPSTFGVRFDISRPPFDDVRVRRAFVLATDPQKRGEVVGHGFRGFTFPATGGLVPHGMPGHSPGIGLPYDPQRARQLLAEAGYPGGRDFPVADAVAHPENGPGADHLRAQWRDNLEVDIQWKIGTWSALVRPGELPHMWYYGLAPAFPDPDDFLRLRSPAHLGWRNETYDDLVEQARREMDPAERMKLYRQADKMLIEEAVILPISYGVASMLVKPWVKKLPATPFGWYLWKNVIIDPH
jgi:oligopeptide transport system substrate-binding protein